MTANTFTEHPPVPKVLQEALKDYPELIAKLEEGLKTVGLGPGMSRAQRTDELERAFGVLQGDMDDFVERAHEELAAANASTGASKADAAQKTPHAATPSARRWKRVDEVLRLGPELRGGAWHTNTRPFPPSSTTRSFGSRSSRTASTSRSLAGMSARKPSSWPEPGAGKGGLVRTALSKMGGNAAVIDPDELRSAHPNLHRLRSQKPYTWSGETHSDASRWAQELRADAVAQRKHLVIDTTMPRADVIKKLKAQGYEVEVRALATHRLESELGVDNRFTSDLDRRGHGRHVPQKVRSAVYDKLPDTLDDVAKQTGVPIRIYDREGRLHFDSRTAPNASPGRALETARFGRLSQDRRNDLQAFRQAEQERLRVKFEADAKAREEQELRERAILQYLEQKQKHLESLPRGLPTNQASRQARREPAAAAPSVVDVLPSIYDIGPPTLAPSTVSPVPTATAQVQMQMQMQMQQPTLRADAARVAAVANRALSATGAFKATQMAAGARAIVQAEPVSVWHLGDATDLKTLITNWAKKDGRAVE